MKNKRKMVINLAAFLLMAAVLAVPLSVLANVNTATTTSTGNGWSIDSVKGFGLPKGSIKEIATGILQWLLGAIGIIGIIGFAISGIMYLLSFGDDERMKLAKSAMYYSITGVVVGLVGLVAVQAIAIMLNGQSNF